MARGFFCCFIAAADVDVRVRVPGGKFDFRARRTNVFLPIPLPISLPLGCRIFDAVAGTSFLGEAFALIESLSPLTEQN